MKHQLLRIAGAIIARADAVLNWSRRLIAESYETNVREVLASVDPGGETLAPMESSNLTTRRVAVSLRSITT